MNNFIARQILHAMTSARKQPLFDALNFLGKSQWWPYEKIQEYQNAKLSKLIKHCSQNVPYYRQWFKEQGCNPSDIDLSNLNLLPIIDKATLRYNLKQLCAENYLKPFEQAKTSGSTGLALHFPKSLSSSAFQLAAMYRGHGWHGVEPGAKEARLWGIHVNKKSRIKTVITDLLLNRFREREYNLNPDVLDDFHYKLKKCKPDYLMGYTSMVSQFAMFLRNRGYNGAECNLKMVKCTSETIHASDKEIIEDVFGCPLVSEYGAAETGIISFQCNAGSHHLMSDCCIVEFLEPEENLDDINLKEVVVTNLDNYALPVIRYKIGDYAIPSDEICSCGRELPVVNKIVGRVSDVIKTSDGRRWHSIILYYIMKGLDEKDGGVIQFKAKQSEMDSLELLLVPDSNFSAKSEEYIKVRCREHFGEKMRVKIKLIDSIPREQSGKLRDFVSTI